LGSWSNWLMSITTTVVSLSASAILSWLSSIFVFKNSVQTMVYWHVYVLGGAYFMWPWKSRAPHRDIVTSQWGHCPLLIRVSGITWCGSKLLETLTLVRVTYARVGAGSGMGGGRRKTHVLLLYVSVIFLTCDMYKSSLRHIHDPVLSSLKMKGILFFFVTHISYSWQPAPHIYRLCTSEPIRNK
jgi:hypothetical protein